MGAVKQKELEQVEWESNIHVENFMRANGVEVKDYEPSQFGNCIIQVAGTLAQGDLRINLTMTRQEGVNLLRSLGMPVFDVNAG